MSRMWKKILKISVKMSKGTMKKSFVFISIGTACLVIMFGLMLDKSETDFPSLSLRMLSGDSNETWITTLAHEVPYGTVILQCSSKVNEVLSEFVFEVVTDINLRDPSSFLERELPGFKQYRLVIHDTDGVDHSYLALASIPPSKRKAGLRKEGEQIKNLHSSRNNVICS